MKEEKSENLIKLGGRGIDTKFVLSQRKYRGFTQRVLEDASVFIGVRNNRLTFYYKGRELFTLNFNSNSEEDITITTRQEFENNQDLNDMMYKAMSEVPLNESKTIKKDFTSNKKGGKYLINRSELKGYSIKTVCQYLIEKFKEPIDKYYEYETDKELPVQGKYMSKYNFQKNKDLYILDMEFILSKDLKEKIGKEDIKGRYDMLALKKYNDKYKLVFIELKCTTSAIKDKSSGVNSHINDMDNFLCCYNSPNSKLKAIMEQTIKEIIRVKGEDNLKLIKGLDVNQIDFDNPEFWIIFDMLKNEKAIKKEDVQAFATMEKSGATLKFYTGTLATEEYSKLIDLEETFNS